ncbi:MAG TPA: GHKL domain-containing protein [bacterium]|nr:GHKL domain-containing protein [bacterium]
MKKHITILGLAAALALPGFGRTFTVTLDGDSLNRHGIELRDVVGLPWILMPSPEPGLNPNMGRFFGFDAGWLMTQDQDRRSLYRFIDGRWNRVRVPFPGKQWGKAFYPPDSGSVWVSVQTEIPYKEDLARFDGKSWQYFQTPNTDGIRTLWMISANEGWAGCEWGQIMRWDGRSWTLQHCPTTLHIENLFFTDSGQGWAGTDAPFSALRFQDGMWEPVSADSLDWIAYQLVSRDNFLNAADHPALLKSGFRQAGLSAGADTLRIETAVPVRHFFWVSESGVSFFKSDYLSMVSYADSAGRGENVLVQLEDMKLMEKGRSQWKYVFFTREGPSARLVVEIRPSEGWIRSRVYRSGSQVFYFGRGIGILDADKDGFEDIYVVVTDGQNRIALADGGKTTFRQRSAADMGARDPVYMPNGRMFYDEGVSCADADNDGDDDIFVTSLYGPNLFFRNRSGRGFFNDSKVSGLGRHIGRSTSGIWGDVNRNGFLDLLVSNEDSTNRLYLNNGAGVFKDATEDVNLCMDRGGSGSVFGDVDGNGRLDLFIPRRGARNLLFLNTHGNRPDRPRFIETGAERGVSGADTLAHSCAALLFDMDNDGDPDLFVANLTGPDWLYRNDGGGHFTDVTESSGLTDSFMTTMALAADVNHDGNQDLILGTRSGIYFYENTGSGRFLRKSVPAFESFDGHWVTGLAALDIEDDGDPDLIVAFLSNYVVVFHNETNDDGYLKLRVSGTRSNRDAIGAKVFLYSAGRSGDAECLLGFREISGGSGYNSMSSRIVHFGVPDGLPKDVVVRFPFGIERVYPGLTPGRTHDLAEETGFRAFNTRIRKWTHRILRYPRNHENVFILFIAGVLLSAGFLILEKAGYSMAARQALYAGIFGAVLVLLLTAGSSFFIRAFLACAGGLVTALVGILAGHGLNEQPSIRDELLERLFLSISNFYHGEWGARKLGRIELFAANLEPGKRPPADMQNQISGAANDYFRLVVPEIRKILEYARKVGIPKNLIKEAESRMEQLARAVNAIRVESRLEGPDKVQIRAVRETIEALRQSLSAIRRNVYRHFCADIVELTRQIRSQYESGRNTVKFDCRVEAPVMVRIRSSEVSQILENLIDNALDAARKTDGPHVSVILWANADLAFVEVRDRGTGVEPGITGRLFRERVSTKQGNHGSGLHRAARTLRRYGGDIFLTQTGNGQETVFRIQLKRVYDA